MKLRPGTPDEYAGLVNQVIDELEDILEASRYDFDEVGEAPGFVEQLLKEMRELRQSMADGSYQFGRNDLPFMRIVKKFTDKELPCIRLFYLINQTHREGLDID
jgi:hypothetical protein